jgi:hypothetical protein
VAKDDAVQKVSDAREPEQEKDTCFTIMPLGGWFDQFYLEIYKPAIESTGLSPRRADDLYRPRTIVHDIWEYTRNAKVILADLTGKNPNVFYELGLGHALAKTLSGNLLMRLEEGGASPRMGLPVSPFSKEMRPVREPNTTRRVDYFRLPRPLWRKLKKCLPRRSQSKRRRSRRGGRPRASEVVPPR